MKGLAAGTADMKPLLFLPSRDLGVPPSISRGQPRGAHSCGRGPRRDPPHSSLSCSPSRTTTLPNFTRLRLAPQVSANARIALSPVSSSSDLHSTSEQSDLSNSPASSRLSTAQRRAPRSPVVLLVLPLFQFSSHPMGIVAKTLGKQITHSHR
jgi:hypothetical protein